MNFILYRILLGCLAVILGVLAGILAYVFVEALLVYAVMNTAPGSRIGAWTLILSRGIACGMGYFFTAMVLSPSRARRPIEAYTIVGLAIWLVGMSGSVEAEDWTEAWSYLAAAITCGILGVSAGIRLKRKEQDAVP